MTSAEGVTLAVAIISAFGSAYSATMAYFIKRNQNANQALLAQTQLATMQTQLALEQLHECVDRNNAETNARIDDRHIEHLIRSDDTINTLHRIEKAVMPPTEDDQSG